MVGSKLSWIPEDKLAIMYSVDNQINKMEQKLIITTAEIYANIMAPSVNTQLSKGILSC